MTRHRALGLVAVATLAACTGPPAPPDPGPAPAPGAAPSMTLPRAAHTATPVPDGRILVVGGCVHHGCDGPADSGRSEFYDSGTGGFTVGPSLHQPRAGHTATLLADGRILITGGYPGEGSAPLASAEVYDPRAGRFDLVAPMAARRGAHTATRLRDGRVLVVGGADWPGFLASAEVFDPATARFTTVAPLPGPRGTHAATLLGDGRVLVAGGQSSRTGLLADVVAYDPGTGRWAGAGRLAQAKYKLALAPLPDGGALVVGGQTSDARSARLATTERFDPRTRTFRPGPTMAEPRFKISDAVVALPDGRVVIAGGTGVEVYDGRALTRVPGATGGERLFPAVAALPGGGVLVSGGYDNQTRVTATAFVVTP